MRRRSDWIVLLCCALAAAGCRRGGPASPGASGEPERLEELIPWTYERLLTPLDAAPVPERRGASRWPAAGSASGLKVPLRLATLLEEADIRCAWRAPDRAAEPLLVIRHRSFAEPGGEAEARVLEFEGGRAYRCLILAGFGVEGWRVGRLELRANFGQAAEFNLAWSQAGKISWPIRRVGETTSFEITTEQLSDWDRWISSLRIGVPALEGNDIVIEELRLLPPESAYPEPVGRRRVMFQRQLRQVIYAHHPAEIALGEVELPEAGRFESGLAVTGGPAARFRMTLRSGSAERVVFEREVVEADTWVELNVPLDDWAGRRAEVTLAVEGPDGGVACWGDPKFYAPQANPPRVLLYLIDTLGAVHMSLYGYERETTPNLAALARKGTWFANAFANASRTVESIPNLMLSMPTISHGVQDEFASVPEGLDLLAESFQRAGYATACFSTNVNAGPRQGLDRGFGEFFDHFAYYWSQDSTRTVPIEEVVGWMERHGDRPMFVYVHTAEPHSPYRAPAPFRDRFDPDYQGLFTGSHTDPLYGFQQARVPRDIEHVIALYDGEVAYADHRFGLFMSRLAERGLDRGLLTVVTSDHGEQFLEHGLWKHGGDVHGELLRVPLILAGPPELVPVKRVTEAVQLLDIWPTLADLCGLEVWSKMYGDSLRPLLSGREAERFADRAILSSTFQPWPPHLALTRLPWKLVFKPTKGPARASFLLYNLAEDPGEREDRLEAEPEVSARMLRELVRTRAGYPRYAVGGGIDQRVRLDREHLERLKALGYVQGE